MASAAQIEANRANAKKSTGPRTPEGKERASRNALRHGLTAREAVIQGEDPEAYELHREEMLGELAPVGVVERMLAERVVGISWRLRRAERLHNAAFGALDDSEPDALLEARHEEWKQLKGNQWDRSVCGVSDEEPALARVVVEDFACDRVLERLLMYERRIESSLYRTMGQLRRQQEARVGAEEAAARSGAGIPAGQEPAPPAELGSFGAEAVSEGVADGKCDAPGGGAASDASHEAVGTTDTGPARTSCGPAGPDVDEDHGRDAHATVTPYGVTTNSLDRARPVPNGPAKGQSCETNPISGARTGVGRTGQR